MFEDLLQKIMDWVWRHQDLAKGIVGFVLISSAIAVWEALRERRKEQGAQEPESEEDTLGNGHPSEGTSPLDMQAEEKREELAKIDEWVKRDASMKQWDWTRLGHTISRFQDAVRKNPDRAGGWILLAYAYHLAGFKKHAWESMHKALGLIQEDQIWLAHSYSQVYRAIRLNAYITGRRVKRPSKPDWFSALYGIKQPVD